MVDQPRPLTVTTPLGPDVLQPVAFRGTEAISQLFRFELDAVAATDRPVPFDELLGRPVLVRVEAPRTPPRFFSGICSRVSQGARDAQRTSYRLELVPQLWLLTRTSNLRGFQDLAAPEILERVLLDESASFELRLPYATREYCVQYRESDFDFASRLMADEGIWFAFRHGEDGHRLVVADSADSHVGLPAVQFDPRAGPGTVFSWEKAQELAPGRVTLRDHDFLLPQPVEGDAEIPESARIGSVGHLLRLPANEALEVYDYPGSYAQRFDGVDEAERTASDRMRSAVAASLLASGESTATALQAGFRFALERHGDADGQYVLTQVSHDAQLVDLKSPRLSYSNTFTCIPDSVPYRPPRRTSRPTVGGVQTAVVVGPPGEEIHVDELGRVKVRFHWDRQEGSSTWIRVAQPHAGGSLAFWLPEVDDEVLVAFEHGDPNRPYVLGRLFNGNDRPPPAGGEEGG